jgi:hypothetical protein
LAPDPLFFACLSLLVVATSGCPRHGSAGPGEAGGDAAIEAAGEPRDPRVEELWTRAKEGEADDLARLADREGVLGLEERGRESAYRLTALRAMGYTASLEGLPWLGEVATEGSDGEALAALESAAQVAGEPRRAVDPEDALEVRQGCDALLALAVDPKRPPPRRVGAIRAIRMLADRGCSKPGDLPADLDAK